MHRAIDISALVYRSCTHPRSHGMGCASPGSARIDARIITDDCRERATSTAACTPRCPTSLPSILFPYLSGINVEDMDIPSPGSIFGLPSGRFTRLWPGLPSHRHGAEKQGRWNNVQTLSEDTSHTTQTGRHALEPNPKRHYRSTAGTEKLTPISSSPASRLIPCLRSCVVCLFPCRFGRS